MERQPERGTAAEVPRRLRPENRKKGNSQNRSKDSSLARTSNRQKPVGRGAFGQNEAPLHGPAKRLPQLGLQERTHVRHGPDLAPVMQATPSLSGRPTTQSADLSLRPSPPSPKFCRVTSCKTTYSLKHCRSQASVR